MARKAAAASSSRSGIGLLSLAAAGLAVGAGIAALLVRRAPSTPGGHRPADLEGDSHPGPDTRAAPDFRPDPTAPVAAADREAFRPATSPVPFPNDVTIERAPA